MIYLDYWDILKRIEEIILMHENKIFTNPSKNKQFRIVKRNKNNNHNYISKRVIRYVTIIGINSVGVEKEYKNFNEAFKAETRWLKNE